MCVFQIWGTKDILPVKKQPALLVIVIIPVNFVRFTLLMHGLSEKQTLQHIIIQDTRQLRLLKHKFTVETSVIKNCRNENILAEKHKTLQK